MYTTSKYDWIHNWLQMEIHLLMLKDRGIRICYFLIKIPHTKSWTIWNTLTVVFAIIISFPLVDTLRRTRRRLGRIVFSLSPSSRSSTPMVMTCRRGRSLLVAMVTASFGCFTWTTWVPGWIAGIAESSVKWISYNLTSQEHIHKSCV